MFSIFKKISFADLFSIFNMFLGFLGIVLKEISFIFLSAIMDGIDGMIARNGKSSKLGKELDSLADIVSFGVCPAYFIYNISPYLAFFYLSASALRLARFNVSSNVNGFIGMPITSGGIIVASTFNIFKNNLLISSLFFIISFLMISDVIYPKIKDKKLLISFAMLLLLSVTFPKFSILVFLICMLYAIYPFLRMI